jgi:hypothetical protein
VAFALKKTKLFRGMDKVFGIGWAKTGTTTLGKCFQILGFDHQSQRLDLVSDLKDNDLSRIKSIAAQKESFEDWPWIILFKELDELFHGSKFVLTTRDEERWLKSYRNMLESQENASEELNEVRRILYDLPFPNVTDKELLERYRSHNREVVKYFSDRPDTLLVVNWEEGDGWDELCNFLGLSVPAGPFPHANKGRYTDSDRYTDSNVFTRLLSKLLP